MVTGIITQPLYANYGGILQNYALQQVLKEMGHSPVTLDYLPSLAFGRYLLYVGKWVLLAPFPRWSHPLKPYRHFLDRQPEIAAFVKDNIVTTRKLTRYSAAALRKHEIKALVVGSDQVWRYAYNAQCIEDMYLGFAQDFPCLKLAYGASFGVDQWDYPETVTNGIKELVKRFDAISVRENAAIGLCQEHLGVDARLVLDPTLLLPASEYAKFCPEPVPDSAPYLAAYILDINEEKRNYIAAFAAANGLAIKDMTVSDKGVSIEEWLSTIKHAEFVITDSYHGSLFSIIFQKQFQTILNKERGADRFLTVFDKLGLTSRLSSGVPTAPEVVDSIDYAPVFSKLNRLREESISFLRNSLR